MYFDGSKCKHGCSVSVVFKSLGGHMRRFSFRFTWICINNAIEYESLYLGLSKLISMGIICLVVHGDSDMVIKKVRDQISAIHHYLKTYKNRVWDLLESFMVVNFISILRMKNKFVDALAGKGAHYNLAYHKRGSYGVKVLCRPYVTNTAKFW